MNPGLSNWPKRVLSAEMEKSRQRQTSKRFGGGWGSAFSAKHTVIEIIQ